MRIKVSKLEYSCQVEDVEKSDGREVSGKMIIGVDPEVVKPSERTPRKRGILNRYLQFLAFMIISFL
jgi:hypothetical protein